MYLISLHNVLPPEIIHIIYLYCREKSTDKISKFCGLRNFKIYALNDVIKHIIYNRRHINGMSWCVSSPDCIENVKNVLNSEYSRLVYNHEFWQYLLGLFSYGLMRIHNDFIARGVQIFKSDRINLKIAIELWLKLCKKYNMKLCLGIYDRHKRHVTYERTYARSMIKMKNFESYALSPGIELNSKTKHCVGTWANSHLRKYLPIGPI
jgi:hypothetical protein